MSRLTPSWPLAGLALLALLGCSSPPAERAESPRAADWALELLDGQGQLRLSEQRGKVVVLTFWASWCGPCKRELPSLQKLYDEYADQGLQVIGVSLDSAPAPAQNMAKRLRLRFPLVFDGGGRTTGRHYKTQTIPTTYVLDKQGRIRARHVGFSMRDAATLRTEVRALLQESDSEKDP